MGLFRLIVFAAIGFVLFKGGKVVHRRAFRFAALAISIASHLVLVFAFSQGKRPETAPSATRPGLIITTFWPHAESPDNNSTASESEAASDTHDVNLGATDFTHEVQSELRTSAIVGQQMELNRIADDFFQDSSAVYSSGQPAPKSEPPIIALPVSVGARYFTVKELTSRPQVLQDLPANITLHLPEDAPERATVRLLIDEQGKIDTVIVEDQIFSAANEKLLKETFQRILFSPGKIGELTVKSQIRIEVQLEKLPLHPTIVVPPRQVQ